MPVKKEIEELIGLVDDPRCLCDVRIPLFDILAIGIAFVTSGVTGFSKRGLYLDTHGEELKRHFHIQHIPSERTMRPFWQPSGACSWRSRCCTCFVAGSIHQEMS